MFIDVHTHVNFSKYAIQNILAQDFLNGQYPTENYFTTGLHPWFVDEIDLDQFIESVKAFKSANLIGIGECGLDRLKGPNLDFQKEMFERQLHLARELNYPVVVHQVKAISDLLPMIKKHNDLTYIFHGYNGNEQQTTQLLIHDVYFSFGEMLLRVNKKMVKTLESIPVERMFLETDESSLKIEELYKLIADIKAINESVLGETVLANFKKVFKRSFNELD